MIFFLFSWIEKKATGEYREKHNKSQEILNHSEVLMQWSLDWDLNKSCDCNWNIFIYNFLVSSASSGESYHIYSLISFKCYVYSWEFRGISHCVLFVVLAVLKFLHHSTCIHTIEPILWYFRPCCCHCHRHRAPSVLWHIFTISSLLFSSLFLPFFFFFLILLRKVSRTKHWEDKFFVGEPFWHQREKKDMKILRRK